MATLAVFGFVLYSLGRMTKQELVEKLAQSQEKRNVTKAAAQDVVESMFDNLCFVLKRKRRFTFSGFGTFLVKKRKERKGINPQTGEAIQIEAFKTIRFKPSDKLKKSL